MAALNDVLAGVQARLSTIQGVRSLDYIADQVPVPCAVVSPGGVDYDTTMARGCDSYTLNVFLVVARATDRWAQSALGDYVASSGAKSVKAAIEADAQLGGVAQTLRVTRASQPIQYSNGDISYLAVEFTVEVIA